MSSNILITGAGGFLGQALALALLQDPTVSSILLTDIKAPPLPPKDATSQCKIDSIAADLTIPEISHTLLNNDLTHIYLLHGIMSGTAESNLELGLTVNIDSMRHITNTLRTQHRKTPPPPIVIFPSSLAVFGPSTPGSIVTESTQTSPQSSYGTQKAITELLLSDFSRRGILDARILRLPTIVVRPGQPSGAASSFCSGMIREPLNGIAAVLPVKRDLKLWICSTRTIVRNLVLAKDVPASKFGPRGRIVNLPGQTVNVQQMIDALGVVGGQEALSLLNEEYDEQVERIVGSWPAEFDTSRAVELGFEGDVALEQVLRDYITDYMSS